MSVLHTMLVGNDAPIIYGVKHDVSINALITVIDTKNVKSIEFQVTRPNYGSFAVYGLSAPDMTFMAASTNRINNTTGALSNTLITVDVSAYDYINISLALGNAGNIFIINSYE